MASEPADLGLIQRWSQNCFHFVGSGFKSVHQAVHVMAAHEALHGIKLQIMGLSINLAPAIYSLLYFNKLV